MDAHLGPVSISGFSPALYTGIAIVPLVGTAMISLGNSALIPLISASLGVLALVGILLGHRHTRPAMAPYRAPMRAQRSSPSPPTGRKGGSSREHHWHLGASAIGFTLARLAISAGDRVIISDARGPHTLEPLIDRLGDNAQAAATTEAALAGDIVIAAVPLANISALPLAALDGKIVIDTRNYFPMRDGRIASLWTGKMTRAGPLQHLLPTSNVLKAFNHIRAADLATDATPPGSPHRRAVAVYGDDDAARLTVIELVNRYGFDPVGSG